MSALWATKNLLALDPQEELAELPKDDPLSSSEEEGGSERERKHQKFLEAISSLDGKNGWKLPERSEASLTVSEFSISSEGSGEKLVLSDLFESLKAAPSSLATVKKQLNRVKSKKTVDLPLSEEEVAQTHRQVASREASQALSKWDPIVLKNRRAMQLVFPLNPEPEALAPLEHLCSGWKARTPLEQEIFKLLRKHKQPVADPLLTPVEKACLEAMSLEEAKMRRSRLQRARALQSYYEARARRERKIKSKKYHKVLKKEKAKKSLKEFEALQKLDPTAALRVLEKIESTRVMERMSLRHQNRGRWARSKAIMARYHLETRQARQEQLARSKELMQKLQAASESEEEGAEAELGVPDAASEIQMGGHRPNPWMCRSLAGDAREETPEQISETVAPKASESEEEEPMAEEILLKEFEERWSLREMSGLSQDAQLGRAKGFSSWELLSKWRAPGQRRNMENHPSRKQQVSSPGAVLSVQRDKPAEEEAEALLQRPAGTQTPQELEELSRKGCFQTKEHRRQWERNPSSEPVTPKEKKRKERVIDLQNLLTMESSISSLAVPTSGEGLEGVEESSQKQMIKEAFAGDDVIRDFLQEKREAVEASKPKDTDLSLPGWGEWGGACLKPSAKKRCRFLIKAPEGPPRKDKDLPNVIINENRNVQAAAHQVRALPYPFTYCQQFERTIQTPTGCMWNTRRAFQNLTAPSVVTRSGHIITPIEAEDVGYGASSRSGLSASQMNPEPHSLHHKNN